MEWLNYHHLHYFFMVAREGGLAQAARALNLSHPTLSSQIHALESSLGEKLFRKEGRRLVLTESGRLAYRYAEEIFGLGKELLDAVHDRPTGRPVQLQVGVVDAVPKMAVHRILEPVLHLADPVRMLCREGKLEALLQDMAAHELDAIVSDAPLPPGNPIRAYAHLLGESEMSLFAAPQLAATLRKKRFPESLDGAPMLFPAQGLPTRRALDRWFEEKGLRPRIVAEFEDSALMKAFGAKGAGVFPSPTVFDAEVRLQYGVKVVGQAIGVKERFYVITAERRLKHPAVAAIAATARTELFQ